MNDTQFSAPVAALERSFSISAIALSVIVFVGFFLQRAFMSGYLLPSDLEWSVLSLLLLLLNFRSWCFFGEFICGRRSKLVGFFYLKTISLSLLIGLLVLGRRRALLIFFILLALFLFLGLAIFYLGQMREKTAAKNLNRPSLGLDET